MGKNILYRVTAFLLAAGMLLSSAACAGEGKPSAAAPRSTEKVVSESSGDPDFWDECIPVSGVEHLYEWKPDGLSDKNYAEIAAFGDGFLLISTYFNLPEEAGASDGGYYEDDTPFYQFEYYDLSEKSITASLNTEQQRGSSYQVISDQLFVFCYESRKLLVYDSQLRETGSYNLGKGLDDYATMLYPGSRANEFYVYNYELSEISLLELSNGEISVEPMELDSYVSQVWGAAPDGSGLIFAGIDKKTLRAGTLLLDTLDLSETRFEGMDSIYTAQLCPSAYLIQQDFSQQVWLQGSKDGRRTYYMLPDGHFLSLQPDGKLLETYNLFPENASPVFGCGLYGADGRGTNSFSVEYSIIGADAYVLDSPAYLKEYGCMMFMACDGASDWSIFVWDIRMPQKGTGDLSAYSGYEQVCDAYDRLREESGSDFGETETETDEDPGSLVTLISDPQNYDWGDLAGCRRRADEIGEKYGISIYLGPEVPGIIVDYKVGQCLDSALVSEALEKLDSCLACYPDGFWDQLLYNDIRDIRFYLAGGLEGMAEGMVTDTAGFACEPYEALGIVLSMDYLFDLPYTIHHEISHLIDGRLVFRSQYVKNAVYSEEKWSSYNPKDYNYLESYDSYEDSDVYVQYQEYFLGPYGTTYPTEDRAMIFGAAMANYLYPDSDYEYYKEVFAGSPEISAKLAYYSECIADCFDTSGWPETLPWEEILR